MNEITNNAAVTDAWDSYWQGARKATTPDAGGARDESIGVFWNKFFREEFPRHNGPRILDAACGNGAVTERARQVTEAITGSEATVTCMDSSSSAIKTIEEKFPGVRGVVCDASDTPFGDGDFDIVASQFGLEYAGNAAFDEAARLIARDGVFVAIVHMRKGAIYDECKENFDAIQTIEDIKIVPLARAAFDAGYAVIAGNATQAVFREADKNLAPAVEVLKEILDKHGPYLAGGVIHNLGADLGHMYKSMQSYVPKEVSDWFDLTEKEIKAYSGRMQSMVDAAMDEAEIKELSDRLKSKGLTVDTHDVLRLGSNKQPAAWILVGRRLS